MSVGIEHIDDIIEDFMQVCRTHNPLPKPTKHSHEPTGNIKFRLSKSLVQLVHLIRKLQFQTLWRRSPNSKSKRGSGSGAVCGIHIKGSYNIEKSKKVRMETRVQFLVYRDRCAQNIICCLYIAGISFE